MKVPNSCYLGNPITTDSSSSQPEQPAQHPRGPSSPLKPRAASPPKMQKLLKRTATAERVVAKRTAKKRAKDDRAEARQQFVQRMTAFADANKIKARARQNQREDWTLGALAPQRDNKIMDPEFRTYFGSAPLSMRMSPFGEKQLDLICKWAGGRKYLCLKPGDRVAIMQGPYKGKIAPIRDVDLEVGAVTLDGDDMQVNWTVNPYMYKANPEIGRVSLAPLQVPIHAVRLVHPLVDPITNQARDVLVNELVPTDVVHDGPTGRVTWSRLVPGLNTIIPWPRSFEEAEEDELYRVKEDWPCDTTRRATEKVTWVPTLVTPPMPSQVLDELRSRYSRFRTRHEPEYIKRKEDEARGPENDSMQTPLQELRLKLKEERKSLPRPKLSPVMLAKLGQYMSREYGMRFSRVRPKFQASPGDKGAVPLPRLRSTPSASNLPKSS